MDVYKEMYLYLFNRVTDALRAFDGGAATGAAEILRAAQRACEEMHISGCDLRQE